MITFIQRKNFTTKKFLTNNLLENCNRTFKRLYEMKENMNLITYLDNLVEIFGGFPNLPFPICL